MPAESTRGESFDAVLDRYLGWLRHLLPEMVWSEVLVTERRWVGGKEQLPFFGSSPPAEFAARFDAIVSNASRDWVNLTMVGLQEDTLLLALEYIADGERRLGREQVSVNFSGPELGQPQ